MFPDGNRLSAEKVEEELELFHRFLQYTVLIYLVNFSVNSSISRYVLYFKLMFRFCSASRHRYRYYVGGIAILAYNGCMGTLSIFLFDRVMQCYNVITML